MHKNLPETPKPSRRDILASTAAAAGALSLPGIASGQDAQDRAIPTAPDKQPIDGRPVRVAVIGTGGMGGGHIDSMLKQIQGGEDFRIVALADVNQIAVREKATRVKEGQAGVEVTTYGDYKELLANPDVDCVLIAAPEHWHAQMSVDAIAAGKDVYCEKPMTLHLDEALWMERTMEANPHMRLQIGTQYMMLEKYKAAKQLIAEGAIGHPTLSQTSYCRNTPAGEWNYYGIDDRVKPGETLDWEAWCGSKGVREWDPLVYHRWRRYKDFSTGIIGDLLVHMMTPMIYATDRGWPTRVVACGGHYVDKEMENHDQVMLTVEFEGDHTMLVAGSTINENGLETLIRGNEANLFLGSNNCVLRPERPFAEDIEERTIECANVDAQAALRLNWINAVRSREMNISTVDLATKVMVIVDLATRAMWEGGDWRFDPQTKTATKV